MAFNTGGFSRIETLLSALWIELGTTSSYAILEYRYPMLHLALYLAQHHVVSDIEKPAIKVTFIRWSDEPLRRPSATGGDPGKGVAPLQGTRTIPGGNRTDGEITAVAERLRCTNPAVVELDVRFETYIPLGELRGLPLRLEFSSLKHVARLLRPHQ